MTSTNMYMGNFTEKPSSRVLKPPGGGNSNIFGSPEEPKKPVNAKKVENNIFGQPQEPTKTAEKIESTVNNEKITENNSSVKNNTSKVAENNAQTQKATSYKNKQQGSYNPITGESYSNENTNQVKSSTAVRQPPGGASSKLW